MEFGAQVIVKCRGVGRENSRARGIVKMVVTGIRTAETAIKPANYQFLVEQQFLGEGGNIDAQVIGFNYLGPQSQVPRKLLDDLTVLVGRHGVAFTES